MKNFKYFLMAAIVAVSAAFLASCDDDTTLTVKSELVDEQNELSASLKQELTDSLNMSVTVDVSNVEEAQTKYAAFLSTFDSRLVNAAKAHPELLNTKGVGVKVSASGIIEDQETGYFYNLKGKI